MCRITDYAGGYNIVFLIIVNFRYVVACLISTT